MLIDIGHDIELALTAPTALIHLLRVHPSREDDLQQPEHITVFPVMPEERYTDAFGNRGGRRIGNSNALFLPTAPPAMLLNTH